LEFCNGDVLLESLDLLLNLQPQQLVTLLNLQQIVII
jgi:hypothetical protein